MTASEDRSTREFSSAIDYRALLLQNLDTVDHAVHYVARRYCLTKDERDELRAAIHLKLIERDYAVLRQFQQGSTLRTYLTAIVLRHFLDECNARWGKWRPSRIAQKLGGTALRLDELLTRERLSLDESIELLRTNYGVAESPAEITAIARRLPRRTARQFVGDEALDEVAGPVVRLTASLNAADSQADAKRIEAALLAALQKCTAEDLLILRYHFDGGLRVVSIARLMGIEPKRLYRRLEKLMDRMRSELESGEVSRERALQLLEDRLVELRPILALAVAGKQCGSLRPDGDSTAPDASIASISH